MLNHIHKREKGMKDKEKKKPIIDIRLTEEDIEITLLELKRKVGAPKLLFRKKR
tara:strand:+ start:234 stop:395 length:162 start_codon:yes stop_codon:yes gene_type:complete